MPGVTLGFLKYVLGFDSLQFRKGISQADADLAKLQKSFAATGAKLASAGKTMSLGLSLPLTAFGAAAVKGAKEQAAAMAQVNAALTSMGPVAGRTADQLSKAADALEAKSLFDAEVILKQVTAQLLTFGNVAGTQFDRAQQAAVDMATRMGTEPQAAAIMLGKALNDPIKGIAALTKVGVQFTAAQKAQIAAMVETGNVAGAQGVILGEVERQFRGSAAAAANTDPWRQVTVAFGQLSDSIGAVLLPVIQQLTPVIASIANAFAALSPETQKWVVIVGAAVVALGPLLTIVGNLVTVLSKIGPVVSALSAAWGALQVAFVAVRVAALATLPALSPFLVPLGAIALAVGSVYLAWKNWDKISAIVQRVYAGVKTWLMDKLGVVFNWVQGKLQAVGDWFFNLYDRVVGHSYIPDMVEEVGAWIAKLDPMMVQPAQAATAKVGDAFQALRTRVGGLLAELFPEVQQLADQMAKLQDLRAAADKGLIPPDLASEARRRAGGVQDTPIDVASSEPLDRIAGEIEDSLLPKFLQLGEGAKTLSDKWEEVGYAVVNIMGQLFGNSKGGKILGAVLQGGLDIARALGAFGGARAGGGPVTGGRAYLVGEKGPEIFAPSSSGRIVANDRISGMGGNQRIQIVPSPYFDAVVDGRAANVAAPMAGRAAYAGAAGGVAGIRRQAGRRFP